MLQKGSNSPFPWICCGKVFSSTLHQACPCQSHWWPHVLGPGPLLSGPLTWLTIASDMDGSLPPLLKCFLCLPCAKPHFAGFPPALLVLVSCSYCSTFSRLRAQSPGLFCIITTLLLISSCLPAINITYMLILLWQCLTRSLSWT